MGRRERRFPDQLHATMVSYMECQFLRPGPGRCGATGRLSGAEIRPGNQSTQFGQRPICVFGQRNSSLVNDSCINARRKDSTFEADTINGRAASVLPARRWLHRRRFDGLMVLRRRQAEGSAVVARDHQVRKGLSARLDHVNSINIGP